MIMNCRTTTAVATLMMLAMVGTHTHTLGCTRQLSEWLHRGHDTSAPGPATVLSLFHCAQY